MPFNMPVYDADQLSFGPGVIYIAAQGTTPADDVGAVDVGMAVTHSVEALDALQGSPRTLVASFRASESVTFAFTGLEWDLANLEKYLGAGNYDAGPPETFGYGGDLRYTEVSLMLRHQMPPNPGKTVGDCIEIRIWKARSVGDMAMTFAEGLHTFPVSFMALDSGTSWDLAALSNGERYYRMTRIAAPV